MYINPVTVQRRHERLSRLVAVRQQRGRTHRDESDGDHEDADGLDLVL